MGSGASKKKPDSTVQKKLSAAVAFNEAGIRARERREKADGNITEKNGDPKPGHEVQNGGLPGIAEKQNGELQNGDTHANEKEEEEEEDEVFDKVTKIQSVFRGHQERRQLQKQNEMAVKIQRHFRRHRSSVQSESSDLILKDTTSPAPAPTTALPPVIDVEKQPVKKLTKEEQLLDHRSMRQGYQKVLAERKEQRRQRARAWRDKQGPDPDKEFKVEIGAKTKQEFGNFQDEITELKWYSEQQMEITLCGGKDYVPPRILLISSKVPKASVLENCRRQDGVLTFHYDFNVDTFDTILDAIKVNLSSYRQGCMAQSICFYVQGGPGYLYMLKKKVLTTAKLKKENEADQVRFWKEIGKLMSRIHPEDTVIHIMGCNLLGSEKGLELFDDLEYLMQPNIVRFESPLELSTEGAAMVETYFDPIKYKLYKSNKYSKADLKLPPSMR